MNGENKFCFRESLTAFRIHLKYAWEHACLPVMDMDDVWVHALSEHELFGRHGEETKSFTIIKVAINMASFEVLAVFN